MAENHENDENKVSPLRIDFDEQGNPIQPTFVLCARNGDMYGIVRASAVNVSVSSGNDVELTLEAHKHKKDNQTGYVEQVWDYIEDFKLLWCKEWNMLFEVYSELKENEESTKFLTCTHLGKSELSNINLYGIEINTETDIARNDYVPNPLCNDDNPKEGILYRVTNKAPHYKIGKVDDSIKNLQRMFSFDGTSIYDALIQIAEEINCLLVIDCKINDDRQIERIINLYDLESECQNPDCKHRDVFEDVCPKCGHTVIKEGYGRDTGIFITKDSLTDEITLNTNGQSVKNCFKLEAGDDLMTATVASLNPAGNDYIWYITESMKNGMSEALKHKLSTYDTDYEYYINTKRYEEYNIDEKIAKFNELVNDYKDVFVSDGRNPEDFPYKTWDYTSGISGFDNLINCYYDAVDFSYYINNAMMPGHEITLPGLDVDAEIKKLQSIKTVSILNKKNISESLLKNTVKEYVRLTVDPRLKFEISDEEFNLTATPPTWSGKIKLTKYSDYTDENPNPEGMDTGVITISVDKDYEKFLQHRVDVALNNEKLKNIDTIKYLFDLETVDIDTFKIEIKKYGVQPLTSIANAFQTVCDTIAEEGLTNNSSVIETTNKDMHEQFYIPCYERLELTIAEQREREKDLEVLNGVKDSNGNVLEVGIIETINKVRKDIANALDLNNYLGDELYTELLSFKREDKFSNENYISDGLTNAQIIKNAKEFYAIAHKEIYKAATSQHSISTTMRNLMMIPEFAPLLSSFKPCNWLRAEIDGKIYKLRLVSYSINYDSLSDISVEFADIVHTVNGMDTTASLFKNMSSISNSYDYVARQADKGNSANVKVNEWVQNGLNATHTKIISEGVDQYQTWDEHGMLFKKYDYYENDYYPEQLKIVNSSILVTDDNWRSIKTAIGRFYYYDPREGELKQGYGVNGELIIGKMILGEGLGIYSSATSVDGEGKVSPSMQFDHNGLTIRGSNSIVEFNPSGNDVFEIYNTTDNKRLLYFGDDGSFKINADGGELNLKNHKNIVEIKSALQGGFNIIRGTRDVIPDYWIFEGDGDFSFYENNGNIVENIYSYNTEHQNFEFRMFYDEGLLDERYFNKIVSLSFYYKCTIYSEKTIDDIQVLSSKVDNDLHVSVLNHYINDFYSNPIEMKISPCYDDEADWKKCTLTFTLSDTGWLGIYFEKTNTDVENFYNTELLIKDLMLNEGPEPMSWSISPYDENGAGLESKINSLNYEITKVITDRFSSIEENTENISLTVGELQQTVSGNTEELTKMSSEIANLKIEKENVTIEIEKKVKEDLNEITTTTGYKFDKDGLNITKSDSQISTTITENGMTVQNNETQDKMLIANSTGVVARNLVANTYLIISDITRFEKYKDNRIGCFYIEPGAYIRDDVTNSGTKNDNNIIYDEVVDGREPIKDSYGEVGEIIEEGGVTNG